MTSDASQETTEQNSLRMEPGRGGDILVMFR
jgi:hypothetical protein